MKNPKVAISKNNKGKTIIGYKDSKSDISILEELNIQLKRICLYHENKIEIIHLTDVIRCESQSNYTLFHLKNQQKLISCKSLLEYEKILSQYQFVRVHQSHLVNLKFVKTFVKGDNCQLIMTDLSVVEVSRRKKNFVIQHLLSL
jgi:two-component system LytT family response regulator